MSVLEMFRTYTSQIISYPTDKDGLVVEYVQEDCARRVKKGFPLPKLLYIIPSFHNPTGNTLSLSRRKVLVALAEKYHFLILEDDAYGELYFKEQLPTLQSLDQWGRVIYLGSLSKTVAPGLRVGWAFGPQPLMKTVQMLNAERINPFAWALTASYLEHIDYHRHLTWLRAHYCARCQCMLQHLAQIMPASVQWGQPDGGYFLWLTLNEAIDTRQLLRHALAEGVSFVPGSYFYADSEQGQSQLRLSFSWLAEGEMQRGIERLKQAILLQRENIKKGDLYDI
jgi:2-aminoadipate transaminase